MTKEDYMGNEQSYKRLLAEAFIPITPLEGYDALQQVSPANAALVMALESFGFSSGMDYDSAAAIRLSSMNEEVFKETVGKRIIAGTSPGSDERDMVRLIKATEGMKFDDALAIMQANMKERNPKADFAERYANGNLTPYALRKKDLKELMETLDPTVPAGRKIWKGLRHNAKLLDKKIMKAELEVLDKDEARSKLKDYFKRKGYATQYRSGKYGRGSKTSYGEMRDLLDEFYKD